MAIGPCADLQSTLKDTGGVKIGPSCLNSPPGQLEVAP
jgi:hypothetical protein